MRNLEYRVFNMRLSEEVKKELKESHRKSGKSWNLFIKELLRDSKNYGKKI